MKKILTLSLLTLFSLTLVGCKKKVVEISQTEQESPSESTGEEITQNPDLIQTSEKTDKFQFSAAYPKSIQAYPKLEQAVLQEVAALHTQFEEWQDDDLETSSYPWELSIAFAEALNTDEVFSLFGTSYDYTGGAHGDTSFIALNYDKETGDMVTLDILFDDVDGALQAMSAYVREDLRTQLNEVSEEWFLEGTLPIKENYETFTLASLAENQIVDGIGIHFPPYQIAAYSEGSQHVYVPASVFGAFVSAEFQ